VDNIAARKAAERDARNTTGVFLVNSLIKVRPRESSVDDETIAEDVRGALARNPYTEVYDIAVDVKDHVVRLEGSVDSYFDKAEAEVVADRANGVAVVRNYLEVNNPSTLTYNPYVADWSIYDYSWYSVPVAYSKTDRSIKSDIENELFWSPFVDPGQVSVSVEGGVATLTGIVDSRNEGQAAVQNAFEGGAVTVIDKLLVK
jgi:osmotically-inducible protein OsmY